MITKLRYIIVISLLTFCSAEALQGQAVGVHSISLWWGASVPMGDGSFLNKTTVVTPSLEWDYRFNPHFSLGVSGGYLRGHEEGQTHDNYDGGLVDGLTERTFSSISGLVHVRYYPLGDSSPWQPYVILGGGVSYGQFDITGDVINITQRKSTSLALKPGLGLRLATNNKLFFNVDCSWMYRGNDLPILTSTSQQSIEIRIGAGITF